MDTSVKSKPNQKAPGDEDDGEESNASCSYSEPIPEILIVEQSQDGSRQGDGKDEGEEEESAYSTMQTSSEYSSDVVLFGSNAANGNHAPSPAPGTMKAGAYRRQQERSACCILL